ncbi:MULTISPECIES: DUF7385 family protein [Natranaeroarchaeum]|uniref:Flagella cluster protein n=2 Tax=Natranaeroarchaeum TaxID=2917705 RepID=A0A897MTX6_9EURY|nr:MULTISPECIES: hypothetical protein [Natranaeroarchaeum]MCL9815046.1 hypothetical protein [Natranaeroarchaeum aerophilus]QSG02493.1 Uncharacterized protein AArcS_1276 [Natranaeroarchaeum sulfidigenes]
MEQFDKFVSSTTLREENDSIKLYQNTVALACPACEEPFDDMVVCKNEFTSLNQTMPLDLCATVHDGTPVLFTHKP